MSNATDFAEDLLTALSIPITETNVSALVQWQAGEGSSARFNPLDTTEPGPPGTTDYNSVGVKNYPDYWSGIKATADTLRLSYYVNVVSALRDAHTVAPIEQAVIASPWGTQHFGDPNYPGYYLNTRPTTPVPPPEDDMTPAESQQLQSIHDAIVELMDVKGNGTGSVLARLARIEQDVEALKQPPTP